MNGTERIDRIKNLDNQKLVDVVRNYRQYGFDDNLRNEAILILEERGVTIEELKLRGSFDNRNYDYAEQICHSFERNSKTAFVFYSLFIAIFIINPISSSIGLVVISIFFWVLIICYVVFLVKSFLDQNRFYKLIGKEYGSEGALIYLFLGMPFYALAYFYFRNQMKEQMRFIK